MKIQQTNNKRNNNDKSKCSCEALRHTQFNFQLKIQVFSGGLTVLPAELSGLQGLDFVEVRTLPVLFRG